MGGDGGTISSNRTYLRGAGKACHTADHPSNAAKRVKLEDAEKARLILTTCAISGAAFDLKPSKNSSCSGEDIVVCPYGKLYKREEALELLLRRSQKVNSGDNNNNSDASLGAHIRGMKDLHPVRFYVTMTSSSNGNNGSKNISHNGRGAAAQYTATCPITASDISSGNVPSFVVVRSKNGKNKDKKKGSDTTHDNTEGEDELSPNVISERAIKEMGIEGLQSEYGPFEEKNLIRLAPPKAGGVFEEIQRKWENRMEEERVAKIQKKKDKKRKRGSGHQGDATLKHRTPATAPTALATAASASTHHDNNINKLKKSSVAEEARSTVEVRVSQNPVLSTLFSTGKKNQSEKEKSDALFTRNC